MSPPPPNHRFYTKNERQELVPYNLPVSPDESKTQIIADKLILQNQQANTTAPASTQLPQQTHYSQPMPPQIQQQMPPQLQQQTMYPQQMLQQQPLQQMAYPQQMLQQQPLQQMAYPQQIIFGLALKPSFNKMMTAVMRTESRLGLSREPTEREVQVLLLKKSIGPTTACRYACSRLPWRCNYSMCRL